MNRQSTEDIEGSKIMLYVTTMANACYNTFVKTHTTPRVKLNVNYGLWMLMMCQPT